MNGKPTSRKAENRRHGARLAAVQALYQMEITSIDVDSVTGEFIEHRLSESAELLGGRSVDKAFFVDLVRGVVSHQREIDRTVNDTLAQGWRLARLDSTLRALMRAAVYELLERRDVPPRVVISEYLDVAHAFFDNADTAFVNGALDSIARAVRGGEL
jgi:N utilization substance protein B